MKQELVELTEAAMEGMFEKPPWTSFLAMLRRATAAHHATLIFRRPGGGYGDALHLYQGEVSDERIEEIYGAYLPTLELLNDFQMEEGRAYSHDELYPISRRKKYNEYYRDIIQPSNVKGTRAIRVMERSGVSAWLMISLYDYDFPDAAGRMLELIAPALRRALRYYLELERVRFSMGVSDDAMRNLHIGWMSLDGEGKLIDCDAEAGSVLSSGIGLTRNRNGQLAAMTPHLDRELRQAIKRLASDPQACPYAITLCSDPWIDMLLVRSTRAVLSANPRPSVLAYVHRDSWRTADRQVQLAQLFGLSPSESRLALSLVQGRTLSEAAQDLKLSIETIRSYSKAIYQKTGARGLADLIRIVMRSVLAFAPDR